MTSQLTLQNVEDRMEIRRPTHEEIAAIAREIYEDQGQPDGRDVANWREAERTAWELAVRRGLEARTNGASRNT